MRRLLILVIVLAVGYGGYWFGGSRAVEDGATQALADLDAAGWEVSYSALNTTGFPSRFDTTVTDISLTDPMGVFTYKAPFLQAFALSYQPNKVIVAFPPTQSFAVPGATLTLGSEALKMSAQVSANPNLSFANATLAADMLSLAADTGWTFRMADTLLAVRAGAEAQTYDAFLAIDRLTLPDQLWSIMYPDAALPLSIQTLKLDATITTDQELNRLTFQGTPAAITQITLNDTTFLWGDMSLTAKGKLDVDTEGYTTGQITITTENWRPLIEGLGRIGVLEPGIDQTYLNMGDTLQNGQQQLELPLNFGNGLMSLGPLPIGPAPRF